MEKRRDLENEIFKNFIWLMIFLLSISVVDMYIWSSLLRGWHNDFSILVTFFGKNIMIYLLMLYVNKITVYNNELKKLRRT